MLLFLTRRSGCVNVVCFDGKVGAGGKNCRGRKGQLTSSKGLGRMRIRHQEEELAKQLKGTTCLLPVERYKQGNIKYTGNLDIYIW